MNVTQQKQAVGHRLILKAARPMINRNLKRANTRAQQKTLLRKEW